LLLFLFFTAVDFPREPTFSLVLNPPSEPQQVPHSLHAEFLFFFFFFFFFLTQMPRFPPFFTGWSPPGHPADLTAFPSPLFLKSRTVPSRPPSLCAHTFYFDSSVFVGCTKDPLFCFSLLRLTRAEYLFVPSTAPLLEPAAASPTPLNDFSVPCDRRSVPPFASPFPPWFTPVVRLWRLFLPSCSRPAVFFLQCVRPLRSPEIPFPFFPRTCSDLPCLARR